MTLPAPAIVDPVAVESFLALFDDCDVCHNSGDCFFCDGRGVSDAPALGVSGYACGACLGTSLCNCCHDVEAAARRQNPAYDNSLKTLRAMVRRNGTGVTQ